MTRIPPITRENATPEQRAAYDAVSQHHSISNMKAAALQSPAATEAILVWYKLFAAVKPWLGERLAVLFCDAISRENRCDLCASFMKKEIVLWGEDPDNLKLDDRDATVIAFGRQLARDANRVNDDLYAKLEKYFSPPQIVELTVFGTLMIMNNLFNSALRIPLDDALDGYHVDPETYFT